MERILSSIWRLQISTAATRSVCTNATIRSMPISSKRLFSNKPDQAKQSGTRVPRSTRQPAPRTSEPKNEKETRARRRRISSRANQDSPKPHDKFSQRSRKDSEPYKPRKRYMPAFAGRSPRSGLQEQTQDAPQALSDQDIDDMPVDENQQESWRKHKAAMKRILQGETWSPTRKKLSPDTMDGIRAMHRAYPDTLTTPILAKHFEVSPEAMRRILKSKWQPTEEEDEKRRARWEQRGKEVWERLVREKGYKPPQKWRELGVEPAAKHEEVSATGLGSLRESVNSKGITEQKQSGRRLSTGVDSQWWKENVAPTISPVPNTIPEL